MDIDLPPKSYSSDRKKAREPIFGSGAGALLAELLIGAVGLGLLLAVLLLGVYVKDQASVLLFGPTPTANTSDPLNIRR